MTTSLSKSEIRRRLCVTTALAGGALLIAVPAPAQIVPTGPTPVVGIPTITPTPSPTPGAIDMEVSLNDNRTIINWTSFNIGQDDSVDFTDGFSAGANALAVLNRDLSGNMSQIDGRLTSDANVAVYLLNTNGITFGTGANVNVGALIASTLDLTDADFLDGASYNFTGTGSAGIDIAGGTINGTDAVTFLGHFVNQAAGTVSGGEVAFVAASDVTMASEPGSPLGLTINQGTEVAAPVVVGGMVNGQNVYVGMATKASVTDAVLSISGVVTATTATATDRGIVLAAGTTAGAISVSNGAGQDTGGNAKISITGTLNADDGGTPANEAGIEIRALDTVSASGTITADDSLISSSANGSLSYTGALTSGGNTQLEASVGTVEASGGLTVGGNYSVTAQDFLSGSLSPDFGVGTTNDFTITDTMGGIATGARSAPGTLTINAINGGDITVTGGLSSTNENIALNTGGGGNIAIQGTVTTGVNPGQSVTLNSSGAITQDASGIITTNMLQASATGAVSLAAAANDAVTLGASNGSGLSYADANDLAVTGLIDGGTGDVSLAAGAGAGDSLDLQNATVITSGGGNISLSGAAITLDTAEVSASPSAAPTAADGDVTFSGPVTVVGASTAVAEGDTVRFTNTILGAAGTLNVTVATGAVLDADISLGALTVQGGPSTFGGNSITTANNLTLGDLSLTGAGAVSLTAGGAATLTVGAITDADTTANDLTLTAGTQIAATDVGSGTNPFGAVTFDGPTQLGGSVVASGAVTFMDPLVLSDGPHSITGASTSFGGTVNGTNEGQSLLTVTAATNAFAGSIGNSARLGTLTINGDAAFNGGAGTVVNTTGAQNFNGNLTFAAGTKTFSSSDNDTIRFNGTLNGGGAVTVTTSGDTIFEGTVGAGTALNSLTTNGGGTTILNGGSVRTNGAQLYSDAVVLGAATTLQAGALGVNLAGTVTGPFALTVNTNGTSIFGGAVDVASLTTSAGGTTQINGGSVTTTGDQTYGDPVTLGANTILTGEDVSLVSVTGAGNDLALNFSGATTLNGPTLSGVRNLSTGGGGTTSLAGTVSTTGTQTYNEAVTLAAATTVASSGAGAAGDIIFADTISGANSLAINTAGTSTLGGAVSIASLMTDAGGTTAINGGTVTTSGAQSYGDDVTLGADTILASTGGGAISLGGTVTGAQALIVNTAGTTTLGGAVTIATLTTDAGGTTQVNGGTVTTTGSQTYNDNVALGASTTFTGTNGTFAGTLAGNGTSDLTLTFSGVTSLMGVSNVEDLVSNGGGSTVLNGNVSTSGGQNYADAVTLGADVVLASSGNGAITLASTVGGAQALTVNTGGTTTFGGAVNIAALTTNAGGTTAINGGSVTTTGNQSYGDAVTLGADTTLTGATGTFASTVTGNGNDFALIFSGLTVIDGNFTGIDNLSSAGGGTTQLGGMITTTGSQIFSDNVTLAAATTLTSSGNAAITLAGTVTGAQDLTVNTGGTTTFGGAVNIATLTTDAGGTTAINGGTVTTTGAQTYGDNVTLGADTVLASTGGADIALGGTVTGPRALTVNTAGATILGGAVSIASLVTDAPGTIQINGGSVATTGDQTYGDPVTLGANTILSGEDLSFASITGGGNDLALNFSGTTAINGPLVTGVRNLSSGGGGTTSLAGTISTTGTQTYTDAVTLAADTILESSGMAAAGNISLASTVTGPFALTVNSEGTGLFGGAVSIATLTTDAPGTTAINGGSITTTGTQTYNDAITLGAAATLTGTDGTFVGLTGNGNDLTLNFSGLIDINGDFSGLDDLTANAATIDFVGQTLSGSGAASLTATGTLTGGSLAFGGNVSASGATVTLASVSSTTGDVTLISAGDLVVTDLAAGDDAFLTAGQNLTLTNPSQVVDDLSLTADDFLGVALSAPFAPGFGDDLNITDTLGGLTLGAPLTIPGTLTVLIQNGGLVVNADLMSVNESIALTTTGSGDIDLNANLVTPTAAGSQVSLVSAGAISQAMGTGITTNTLLGSAVGSAILDDDNQVTNLAGFTSDGFTLNDADGLNVTAAVNAGAGNLAITTSGDLTVGGALSSADGMIDLAATGMGSDITLNAAVSSGSLGSVDLQAGGAIGQSAAGIVTADMLTGSSGGATNLGVAVNQIGTLNGFTANGFALRDGSGGLLVNAAVDAGTGDLSLRVHDGPLTIDADLDAAGTVTLAAINGAITQTAGSITANALAGQSVGGTTLDSAGNSIAILSGFTNSGSGGFSLVDSIALDVTGDINAGPGGLSIISAGLDFTGQTLTAGTDATLDAGANPLAGTTVTAGGSITVTASSIDIGTATATGGALSLTASDGALMLGSGTAGTTATLAKQAGAGDLQVTTSLASVGNATIDSNTNARLGSVSASMGTVTVIAPGEVTGVGVNGRANLSAGGTGNDVTVTAGTLARLDTVAAADAVTVSADAIDIASATATAGLLTLIADNGSLALGTGVAGTDAILTKQGAAGELQATTLTAGGVATIDSSTSIRLGDVTSVGNLSVTAVQEVTGIGTGRANLTASADGSDINVSGTLARLGTANAGNDVSVTATNGGIDITTATARTGLLALSATNGDIALGTGSAADTSTLTATGGGVSIANSLISGGDITIGATGDVSIGLADSNGGDINIDAGGALTAATLQAAGLIDGDAASIGIGTADAGSSLTLLARAGQLTLGTGTAGTDATLTKQGATGELQATTLTAGGAATLTSSTGVRLGDVTSVSPLTVTAVQEVTGISGGRANLTAQADSSDIAVSGTLALLGQVEAGNDVRVTATNGGIDITDVAARTGLLALSAANGDIVLGTGTAATTTDLTTTSSGGIAANSLVSGGTITIGAAEEVTLGLAQSDSGNIVIDAGGAITATTLDAAGLIDADGAAIGIGSADAGSSLTLLARSGQLTLGTGSAGTTITLTKQGTTGELQAGTLDAGGAVAIASSTNARLGTLDSGAGGVTIMAAGEVTGLAPDGRTDIAANGSGSDVTLTSGGAALLGTVTATDAIDITAGGALEAAVLTAGSSIDTDSASANVGSATAGTSLNMLARSGQLTLGTGTAGTIATLTKEGTSSELQVTTSLNAGGDTVLASATNVRVPTVVSSGGNVTVTAGGELTGVGSGARANLTAAADTKDINVTAGTNVLADTVTAGNDLRVTAANGSIDITAAAARTGLLALAATNGNVTLDTATAALTSDVTTSGAGSITVATSLISGGNVTLTSADDATLGLVQSTSGNVAVTAADAIQAGTLAAAGTLDVTGNSIATGTGTAGSTIAMTARTGQLTLGAGTAGGTATLIKQGGEGELQVTSLSAGGTATLTSSTNQRLGSIESGGGDALVTAANNVTGLASGSDFGAADIRADGRLQLRAGPSGLVRLSDLRAARGDIDIQAGTAAGAGSQVQVLDTVSAATGYKIVGGTIALGGDGDAETQAAGGAVELTALSGPVTGGAGLTLQSNSDGAGAEVLTITANGAGGAVSFAADSRILGGTSSGGSNVTIDTLGGATLGQVTAAGRTIAISSNDIELQGATPTDLSARVTAATVSITNRADVAGTTRLGNNAGSGGFAMSQAEINRIGAGTATIESGTQDVAIGDLALSTAVGSTRLNLQGTARFDVTGAVSAAGSPGSRTVQIGGNAADSLSDADIRQGSIIRVAATPGEGGRLLMGDASLDLRGAKIGVGQDDNFLAVVGLTPGGSPQTLDQVAQQYISNPNSSLYSAAAPYSETQLLTANKLTVTYSDYALFQNSGIAFVPPSGVTIASLGTNGMLDLFSSGNDAPNGFALFGVINGREGNEAALLGPDIIRLTDVNRGNTRINGCAVGSAGGGCLINAVATPNVAVFDERQANILNTADDLELPFDPIVGTNNEALFAGISSIDEVVDEPEIDCSVDPEAPQCKEEQPADEPETVSEE